MSKPPEQPKPDDEFTYADLQRLIEKRKAEQHTSSPPEQSQLDEIYAGLYRVIEEKKDLAEKKGKNLLLVHLGINVIRVCHNKEPHDERINSEHTCAHL